MANLEYLDISETSISKLPNNLIELGNLNMLILDYTEIEGELPKQICELENLEYLSIVGSKINYIPEEIKKLNNLVGFEYTEGDTDITNIEKYHPQAVVN